MTVKSPARHPTEATKGPGKPAVLCRFQGCSGEAFWPHFLLALGAVLLPVRPALGQLSNLVGRAPEEPSHSVLWLAPNAPDEAAQVLLAEGLDVVPEQA